MVQRLGDKVLPESIASRREQVRQRVQGVRQPIRRFRERNVPGPDVVGQAENQLLDLRNTLVSRDSVVDRIRARRNGSSGDSNSSDSSGESTVNANQVT